MIQKTKTTYPVSLDEAKKHLRLDDDFTDDDSEITSLIETATRIAEDYIGKDIAETTNELKLFDFLSDFLEVNESNLIELTSVKDKAGASYTWKRIYKYDNHFEVDLTDTINTDELTVTFKTGYASGTCPAPIKQAIKMKIWDLYDIDRSSKLSSGVRDAQTFEYLLNPYQVKSFVYRREC